MQNSIYKFLRTLNDSQKNRPFSSGECQIIQIENYKKTEDLIEALDKVLAEGKDTPRVKEGLLQVKEYSWEKTAQETLQIYHRLLSAS